MFVFEDSDSFKKRDTKNVIQPTWRLVFFRVILTRNRDGMKFFISIIEEKKMTANI